MLRTSKRSSGLLAGMEVTAGCFVGNHVTCVFEGHSRPHERLRKCRNQLRAQRAHPKRMNFGNRQELLQVIKFCSSSGLALGALRHKSSSQANLNGFFDGHLTIKSSTMPRAPTWTAHSCRGDEFATRTPRLRTPSEGTTEGRRQGQKAECI